MKKLSHHLLAWAIAILVIILLSGCKVRKTASETKTVDKSSAVHTSDSSRISGTSNVHKVDSSKKITENKANDNWTETEDTETTFSNPAPGTPAKTTTHKVRTYTGNKTSTVTQQTSIKTNDQSNVSKQSIHVADQKKTLKSDSNSNSEIKSSTPVMWWFVAAGIAIMVGLYFFRSFSFTGLVTKLFSKK